MGVRYTHQAITTERQIDILKERGLLIDDVEHAIEVLDTISYFRLAGYWRHFETDRFTHQFREGSSFTDIIDLYSFDKQLRVLLFTAIQTIEVSVRTKIIKHFALEFGAFWFMDGNYATNELVLLRTWLSSARKYLALTMISLQSIFASIVNRTCLQFGKRWKLSQWGHFLNSMQISRIQQQNML